MPAKAGIQKYLKTLDSLILHYLPSLRGNDAVEIIPIGDIDLAYQLKNDNPDRILMGERNGKIQPGFDFGNSPSQI